MKEKVSKAQTNQKREEPVKFLKDLARRVENDDYEGVIALSENGTTHVITREPNPANGILDSIELVRQVSEALLENLAEAAGVEKEDNIEEMEKKVREHTSNLEYVG